MIKKLSNTDCHQQRVFLRADLNVPMQNGQISDTTRIDAVLPTIQHLLQEQAGILIVSHLGRPEAGALTDKDSLAPVAAYLSEQLGQAVPLIKHWLDGVSCEPGTISVAENVRGIVGETQNDPKLSQQMAGLCDVVVMDAFATAHRAHASTCGVIEYAQSACMGPLLDQEYHRITKAIEQPDRPLLALVGGAKVSSKIHLLKTLITKVDILLIGGGMANTFLAASNIDVGDSLLEADCVDIAKEILTLAKEHGVHCPLPVDARVIEGDFDPQAPVRTCLVGDIKKHDRMIDIGDETVALWHQAMQEAQTIIWNGPVGVFEVDAFAEGTKAIAKLMAEHQGTVLAGGGDTVAAINLCGIQDQLSLISTGGGAFLQMLEGKPLATIEALEKKNK